MFMTKTVRTRSLKIISSAQSWRRAAICSSVRSSMVLAAPHSTRLLQDAVYDHLDISLDIHRPLSSIDSIDNTTTLCYIIKVYMI